ncbi:uncharacterized protein LOC143768722 isoform X2 [Ranitomeya variabilis]|uniref:uncharacterized protein LOC143768722 isoform X2 n=1 Tax=Ranitomeya variabilis TaxID=490064 RepID=UPI004057350B
MGDRRHADLSVTRRLWEQICQELIARLEDLDVQAQNQERERIVKRWRSIRDRFKKEFNKEMRAPSGSGGRRSKYKYAQALSFLRSTMVTRSTVGSTREPAAQLNPSGAIPQEAATEGHFDSEDPSAPSHSAPSHSASSHTSDPSVPSTNAGASWPVPLHESAGEDIAFPVPHPSAAATSGTPVALGRLQQRGQVQSYAPEFLHLNASFQNCLKVLSEQMAAGFNLINKSILEMHTLLLTMRSEARQSPNNTFFRLVLEQMETLSASQQMQVMESCQSTLAFIASRAESLATHAATAPPSSTVHHYSHYHPHDLYHQPARAPSHQPHHHPHRAPFHQPQHFQHSRAPSHQPHYQPPARAPSHQYDDPDPYHLASTSSAPPLPAHFQQHLSPPSQPSSPPITASAFQSSQNISYTPPSYQIPNPNPTFVSTRSIAFSTPSPLPIDPSPPPTHSSLHTPTVEVSLSDSPSSTISTPTYSNL